MASSIFALASSGIADPSTKSSFVLSYDRIAVRSERTESPFDRVYEFDFSGFCNESYGITRRNMWDVSMGRLDFGFHYHIGDNIHKHHQNKKKSFGQGKRRMNGRTSMAQREDVIRRTVYVSDFDQQVTEEQLAGLFVNCGHVGNYLLEALRL